jgi:tripartite-type tricarboxylate transporter receptor subunit TctC
LLPPVLHSRWRSTAQAQTYPNRPVRIVLPFAAGGVADVTARIVADKLGEKLGQRFVVENQPGRAASPRRARCSLPADGHTLAMLTNGTAVSVPCSGPFLPDPPKEFTPISIWDCSDLTSSPTPIRSTGRSPTS